MLAGIATADELSARSCTSIADKMARLACYDAALRREYGAGSTSRDIRCFTGRAANRTRRANRARGAIRGGACTSVAKTPEEAFGDTGNLKGTQKPVLPKRLTAMVVKAVPLGQGLYRLTLDNGQIWQTTQADWAVDFDSRNSVTISRMAFGNYLISRTGQNRTVSVKRIQ